MSRMQISAVIGSNWGDEGKGVVVNALSERNTLNIRFNGGSQASHTVVTPTGMRHAFRHFGSGTFKGAKTYLSDDFIVNPIQFCLERSALEHEFYISPLTYVSPNAIVSTIWDINLNQADESMRSENRHGSCGYGINETMQRSYEKVGVLSKYAITVADIQLKDILRRKLTLIYEEYIPLRLKRLGYTLESLSEYHRTILADSENIDLMMFYCSEFLSHVHVSKTYPVVPAFDKIVFEGAQGLCLDQDSKYYPHVTHSHTGLRNVYKVLQQSEVYSYYDAQKNTPFDVFYVTRPYFTKHGAGPFPNELPNKPYERIEDPTNIPNQYQGALRFAYLDVDHLAEMILKDYNARPEKRYEYTFAVAPKRMNIAVTCLDQLDDTFTYIENGKLSAIHAPIDTIESILIECLHKKLPDLHSILLLPSQRQVITQ